MISRSDKFSVRLTSTELSLLQSVASARGESRSECLRAAVRFGLPFVRNGHTLDLYRLIANIEYLQAAIETIIAREYADEAERLLDLAIERVEQFHA